MFINTLILTDPFCAFKSLNFAIDSTISKTDNIVKTIDTGRQLINPSGAIDIFRQSIE